MSDRLVISETEYQGKPFEMSVHYRGGRPFDLRVESRRNEIGRAGTIIAGLVDSVDPKIHAAFVRISGSRMAYLPMKKGEILHTGARIAVQVETEALKTKLPRVTRNLHLAGRFAVLTSERRGVGFSPRISPARKNELRGFLKPQMAGFPDFGCIVRTAAESAANEQMQLEIQSLGNEMNEILGKMEHAPAFSILRAADPSWMDLVCHLAEDPGTEILTDQARTADLLKQTGRRMNLTQTVRYEQDPLRKLSAKYRFPALLASLQQKRVPFDAGADLVIEATEAFFVIDVNTGKTRDRSSDSEALLRLNLAAADAAFREIRLRCLYGTILIDFINLGPAEQKASLLRHLRDLAAAESVHTEAVDLTALGIAEIARKKQLPSLAERLKEGKYAGI